MASVTKIEMRKRGFVAAVAVVALASLAYGNSAVSLTNGVLVAGLSGKAESEVFYSIVVPAGQSELEISISGGTGDCDLYVKQGSLPSVGSYDYRPYLSGNDETVTVTAPAAGTWYIMLRGSDAYSGVALLARYESATAPQLISGYPLRGLSGAKGSARLYVIQGAPGWSSLVVRTWGGTGHVDLFVKRGSAPSPSDFDIKATGTGTDKAATISAPADSRWYILLYGADDYAGVTLQAEFGNKGADQWFTYLSGAAGSESYYVFNAPLGLKGIQFRTYGGTGDCDMYIRRDAKPTTSEWDYRSVSEGNQESVLVSDRPLNGEWHVLLVGKKAYNDVTLDVTYYPLKGTLPPVEPPEDHVTKLIPGVPVTDLAGKAGSEQFFSVEVPSGATNLEIQMSGGTGDADLYVRWGSLPTTMWWDLRPYLSGNDEQATVPKPAAGTWYIMVRGYRSFAGVTLLATFDGVKPEDVTTLFNGVPVTGLAGESGSERFFKIVVPTGQTKLEIALSGGTGDADLYVRLGAKPTTQEWEYRPFLAGNNEKVTIDHPKAGTYYIMVRGYMAYAGATLKATHGPIVDEVKALENGVAVEGLSGAQDSEVFFKIVVPAGKVLLRIETSGGTGDADLYVRKGEKPTSKSWDYNPNLHGNNEVVEVVNPAAATWYIMLRGYQAYAGVTLKARFYAEKEDDDDVITIIIKP